MTDMLTPPRQLDDQPPRDAPRPDRRRALRLTAILAGLIGAALAVAVPLLPVNQQQSSISWPQQTVTDVTAPLVSYSPLRLDVTVPRAAIERFARTGGVVLSSIPTASPDAERYGLLVRVSGQRAQVLLRNQMLLDTPLSSLTPSTPITVSSDANRTTVTGASGTSVAEGDRRPQMVGLFSDLSGPAPAGLSARAELDSRFTTSPSTLKILAIAGAVVATIIALGALHRLDRLDGRRHRRFLPQRWWRLGLTDGVVIATLGLWHIIGSTTADDGYQLGMARTASHAGYMANYFRYFGAPETPVGTPYYNIIGWLAELSPSSPFVRLPALIAGILCWLVISREVAPRLGVRRHTSLAVWTGAVVFLAFWLPYNNGLRPEPIVALGVLLTWCSVERAIATRRLLPAAAAILIAAFTLTAGPSGIICFAALLAGLRPLAQILVRRAREVGYLPLLAPLLASGTAVLTVVFAGPTLASVPVMRAAHEAAGPNVAWFEEFLRYQYLLTTSVDGSLARRFGVLIMFVCLLVVLLAMMRKGGRVPGLSAGPSRRIVGVTLGAVVLMMFTPTKWTHHFGVFAGLAGALAVVAAVAVGRRSLRSARNRALFATAVLFAATMSFASTNGWWYVSSYRIPWADKPPSFHGISFAKVLLVMTVAMLAYAAWCHVREPFVQGRPRSTARMLAPLTIVAGLMVAFEVLSFLKGAVSQYPAYSLARSNIDAIAGSSCGLADDVLMETDPNAGILAPLSGSAASTLSAGGNTGFTPEGVSANLRPDPDADMGGTANTVDDPVKPGTVEQAGLPFGLDPARTPVLGSDGDPDVPVKTLTSGWYRLPTDEARGPILTVAAAGRIAHVDADGIAKYGQSVEVEYGAVAPTGVQMLGKVTPIDIGPAPAWRNLRVPLSALPPNADVVRIVAGDANRDPKQWVAVTPPRVPQLRTLQDVVGTTTPVLLDWAVGLQFPCQQPFLHHVGVADVPAYRILPDRGGAVSTNAWEDHFGGGPLGWTTQLLRAEIVPAYLKDDWNRDWGQIERYTPLAPTARPAQVDVTTTQRSGLWSPGPLNLGIGPE